MRVVPGSVFDGASAWLLNPCNRQTTLYWGTHVSEHIHRHAGKRVRAERRAAGRLAAGGACVTSGGELRHARILHVAVMDAWSLDIRYLFGWRRRLSAEVLERGFAAAWSVIRDQDITAIDVPHFWGGKNGWTDDAFQRRFGGHPIWDVAIVHSIA